MTPTPHDLLFIGVGLLAAIVLFYVIQVGKRMRRTLAFRLKRTVVGMTLYAISVKLCLVDHCSPIETIAISLGVSFLFVRLMPTPKRSRYVPARVKRAVIGRHLGGDRDAEYDSERYHLDHIVPLSKGGDTSIENLRVLPKEKNLKKGARMPRVTDYI
jgi:hypothetical protein